MSNTHGFINTTRMTCWDVDAYNAAGVGAIDFDNGMLVSLGDMKLKDATGGYEFAVAAPAANATELWVIDTPEVGADIDMQIHNDPRYFYNKAGEPMSLRYLNAKVDYIEVPALAFTTQLDPDTVGATAAYVSVETTGKLKAVASAPASGTYFSIKATHSIDIGQEIVKTWILKCERN